LERLASGASAQVYAWPQARALKLFKPGFPREAIERELHQSRVAHLAGAPTPRPEGLAGVDGRTGIVFERCDGPTLYELLAARARPAAELAHAFFDLQQAIHRCAAPALEPIAARLARRLPLARGVPEALRRAAGALLNTAPAGDALCHGDFHPLNVIVGAQRTLAIDWLDAARGDPAIDVTRTLVYLRYSRPQALDPQYRAQFLDAYLDRCRAAWDGRIEELVRWQLPVAVARLAEPLEDAERRALLALIESL
jgi:Ser/Thr protein kinase RdoA (MazF antagonist)